MHRELSRKGIAKAVQIIEKRMRAEHSLHRSDQGRNQQPTDSTIHLALCYPSIKTFAKLIVKLRIGYRIKQPRQHTSIVCRDVAVVQSHSLNITQGLNKAKAVPNITALA